MFWAWLNYAIIFYAWHDVVPCELFFTTIMTTTTTTATNNDNNEAVGPARTHGERLLGVVRATRCLEGLLGEDAQGRSTHHVCRGA